MLAENGIQQTPQGDEPEAFIIDFVPPNGELRLSANGAEPHTVEGVVGLSMKIYSIGKGECGYCTVTRSLWKARVSGQLISICRDCLENLTARADVTNLPPDDFIDIVNDDR